MGHDPRGNTAKTATTRRCFSLLALSLPAIVQIAPFPAHETTHLEFVEQIAGGERVDVQRLARFRDSLVAPKSARGRMARSR